MSFRPKRFAVHLVLWAVALVVFPISVTVWPRSFAVEVLARRIAPLSNERVAEPAPELANELPPEEPLRLHWSERVLIRLVDAESRESDAWFRDDYRVARVTVGLARRGSPIPHIEAAYNVLGCHPDEVWSRIEARRRALLAADYDKVFGGIPSPRKPAKSVRLAEFEQQDNAA